MAIDHEPPRRSFLAWATAGLGALFAAILGAPAVAYVIDPRNRPSAGGDFRAVSGVDLTALEPNRPVQGVIRSVRRDAWTLHPNDVIGRVWIILKRPINDPVGEPAGGPQRARLPVNDPTLLDVFTTICTHLGCSVNLNGDQAANPGFTCPCHAAQFALDGAKKSGPQGRGLDALEWKIEPDPANSDRQLLLVKYQNFKSSVAEKVVL
jgi:menaquinol-cytochrome c reductase iron-sulfur subunit